MERANAGSVTASDTDGIAAILEDACPSLSGIGTATTGDGNGDGKVDSLQSSVASAPVLNTPSSQSNPGSAATAYVSLVADAKDGKIDTTDSNSATLMQVHQLDAPANLPTAMNTPIGQISFIAKVELSGVAGTGITETFSLYVDPALHTNGYWTEIAAGTWINLASAAYGGQIVTEGGRTRLDFTISDGGEFDTDHAVNGEIANLGSAGSMVMTLVGCAPTAPAGEYWF